MQDLASAMLAEDDLNETDDGIIRLLAEGRCSPRYLADELDRQQPYINQRLRRLLEHGHARRVDRGLYELVEPPGESERPIGYREKALQEYGKECQNCGATDNLVVHHRDGDRANNELSNLVPLCETCHGKVHGRSDDLPELVRELGYRPRPDGATTISVTEDLADELHRRKERGDSYEDVIWRLIEGQQGPNAQRGRRDPSPEQPEGFDKPEDTSSDENSPERPTATEAMVDQLFDELAGSGELLEARVDAVLAMYDYLRDHGSAEKEELLSVVDVDATGYQDAGSVWSNMVKGKDTLRALPGVERPPTGHSEWTYDGGDS